MRDAGVTFVPVDDGAPDAHVTVRTEDEEVAKKYSFVKWVWTEEEEDEEGEPLLLQWNPETGAWE